MIDQQPVFYYFCAAKGSNFIAGQPSLRCESTRLPGNLMMYRHLFGANTSSDVVSETLPEGEVCLQLRHSGWRLPTLAVLFL
jgi:hypothetical protein